MATRHWLLVALTVGLLAGCKGKEKAAEPVPSPSVAVSTSVATKPEPRRTLTLYGTLKTDEDRIGIVTSPVEGKVRRLLVREGQDVQAGQPVLELESRLFAEAELTYRKALSEVTYQQALVDRDQALLKQGALSGDELKADQTALAKARADLSAAETQLQIYHGTAADIRRLRAGGPVKGTITVTSPVSGHVLERSVRLGEAVPPERNLMTIVDHARLWVLAHIPEAEIARVREAGTAEVRTKAQPDRLYTGHVIHVHDQVDKGTRTLELKLWIDNPGHVLRPEMFATVRLPVSGETAGAEIPRAALQGSTDGDVVILQTPKGYALQPVKVLEPIGDDKLRISGIKPGETVVTAGAEAIKAQLVPSGGDDE
jgi:cobalt-zinc-cadmium efflux system membrane fusion protein